MNTQNINFIAHQEGSFLIGRDQDYEGNVIAPNGHRLTLIAVIELGYVADILGERINKLTVDRSKIICFFIYYDPTDYYLDYISYHGIKDELDFINEGYIQTVFFDSNEFKFNKQSFFSFRVNEGAEGMSFLGGAPKYLQAENYSDLNDYYFIGQIQGLDLPDKLADLFYLHSNVGYFFIKKDLTNGLFFVQSS